MAGQKVNMTRKTLLLYMVLECLTTSCIQNKNDAHAIKEYTSDTKTNKDTSLLKLNADLLYQGDNYEDAFIEYKRLIKLDSLNGQFHFRVGYCLAQLNRHSESVEYYLRSAELKFEEYDSYYSVGILFYTILGDDKKALYYFDRCLEIKPDAKDVQEIVDKLNRKIGRIDV